MRHASHLRCLEGVEPSLAYRSAGLAESISGNRVFLILEAIIKAHGKNVKTSCVHTDFRRAKYSNGAVSTYFKSASPISSSLAAE